jgi:hypothetical protein
MDMMVLCRCGHPSALHGERGCRAGRYRPCDCRLDANAAIEAAVSAARAISTWKAEADPAPVAAQLHK